jgi:hypothetical protein
VAAPIPSLIALIAGRQFALKLELGLEVTIVILGKGRPGWAGRMRNAKAHQNSTPHSAPNSAILPSLGWTFEFAAEFSIYARIIKNRDGVDADVLANSAPVMLALKGWHTRVFYNRGF